MSQTLDPNIAALLAAVRAGDAESIGVLADALEEAGNARAAKVRALRPKPQPPNARETIPDELPRLAGLQFLSLLEWVFLPLKFDLEHGPVLHPCFHGSTRRIRAMSLVIGEVPNDIMGEMVRLDAYRFTSSRAIGDPQVKTFWVGQCPNCQRVYWTWDGWPTAADELAGELDLCRRVCRLFPEYAPPPQALPSAATIAGWFGVPARFLDEANANYASLAVRDPRYLIRPEV